MRISIILLFLSVTLSGHPEVRSDHLLGSMVQFDKAFIPVLYQTKHNKIVEAKKAALQMRFQWLKLKNRYGDLVKEPAWEDAFCRADEWLGEAVQLIHENEAQLAFIQLNQARYELTELRRIYKIDYYLDEVFRFQEQVQTLSEVIHDEKLYLLEWPYLEKLIGKMNATWFSFTKNTFKPGDYDFNIDKRKRFKALKVNVARELLLFNDTIVEAHQLKMRVAIKALEKEADQLLMLFGNFKGQPTYFASL